MLAEHRIDNANEGLVAIEKPMPPGQQVAFEPALALVLAQHRIQHASVRGEEFIILDLACVPLAVGDFKYCAQKIRERLIRTEDAEIPLILIQLSHVAQELAEHQGILCGDGAGAGPEPHGRGNQACANRAEEFRRWRAGWRPYAGRPWAPVRPARYQAAVVIEQFFRLVALHPIFEQFDVIGMAGVDQQRDLMRAEGALDLQAIDDLRSCHPLGDLRTIIGQRGREASALLRAFFWISRMSSIAFSIVAAMS